MTSASPSPLRNGSYLQSATTCGPAGPAQSALPSDAAFDNLLSCSIPAPQLIYFAAISSLRDGWPEAGPHIMALAIPHLYLWYQMRHNGFMWVNDGTRLIVCGPLTITHSGLGGQQNGEQDEDTLFWWEVRLTGCTLTDDRRASVSILLWLSQPCSFCSQCWRLFQGLLEQDQAKSREL